MTNITHIVAVHALVTSVLTAQSLFLLKIRREGGEGPDRFSDAERRAIEQAAEDAAIELILT